MIEVTLNKHMRVHPDLAEEARAIVPLLGELLPGKLVRPIQFEAKVFQILYLPAIIDARENATKLLAKRLKEFGVTWFAELDASFDDFGQVSAYDSDTKIRIRLHHALTAVGIVTIALKPSTKFFKSHDSDRS